MTTAFATDQLLTWRSVIDWLRRTVMNDAEGKSIESFRCGKGVASITSAKTSQGAHQLFDGERIVASFMDELTQEQKEAYLAKRTLSLRILVPEIGILRCFLIRSANRDILQVRLVNENPDKATDLIIAGQLKNLLQSRSGILITGGPRGSGTTSAYGALMRTALEYHAEGLSVTMGSPVVHDLQDGHGDVLPVNIGIRQDVTRYRDAISQASEMHAHVIGIDGGIDEADTFIEAVKAARNGALVIATLRAKSAIHGLQWLYTQTPATVREHVWSSFVSEFLGIIALDLVPSRYPGEVCQTPDIILRSPQLVPMLLNLDTQALRKYQLDGVGESCSRDSILANMVGTEITMSTALSYALEPDSLKARLGGV